MKALVIVAIGFAMCACAKKNAATAGAGPSAAATTAAAATPAAADPGAEPEKVKHSRVKDAAVYVDGKIVSFLKIRELPLGFKPTYVRTSGEAEYGALSYVRALGLDEKRVRAMHLHGSRVSIVKGDDLRTFGDDIRFQFAGESGGKPRPRFANGVGRKMDLNTMIDLISAVAIYVDKEPPHENRFYDLVYADEQPVRGMAYADAEASAGTRVYVDGKLVSIVKRKALGNELLANDDLSKPQFSLKAYLAQAGVDLAKTKVVDFVSNDTPVARLEMGKKKSALDALTFSVPARNQGLAMMPFGGENLRVTAIQLYRDREPPPAAPEKVSSASSASKG